MTNEPTGGQRRNLAIPPALLRAVEQAVGAEIRPLMDELAAIVAESRAVLEQLKSDDGLTAIQLRDEIKKCKQRLQYAENRIADLESAWEAQKEVARRRKVDIEAKEDEIADLKFQIGTLRSSLANKDGPTA